MTIRILVGDCREIMKTEGPFDMIIGDPPYAVTSLAWDKKVDGWLRVAASRIRSSGSIWVFGSMRSFIAAGVDIRSAGLRYAQDIVWEKQNGTGFHADRFKRVHEHVVQFYREDAAWSGVWNEVQVTRDAVQRRVKRTKRGPAHMGHIDAAPYASVNGGPRIMRSIIEISNCHGRALHETEKPVDLLQILIRTSCPAGGLVGDFFAGSGAAAEACDVAGRNYVGCELRHEVADLARRRSLFVAASVA